MRSRRRPSRDSPTRRTARAPRGSASPAAPCAACRFPTRRSSASRCRACRCPTAHSRARPVGDLRSASSPVLPKPADDASQRRESGCELRHPSGLRAGKFPRTSDQERLGSLPRVVRLAVEIALARAAGRLSRAAGVGGGTTVPGKLLWKVDPGAVDRLAARLPQGSALVSATNGKTTTASMAAEILRPRVRLAHNDSGANLVSGVASTLLEARGAELGLFEVDEAALPEVAARVRPRAVCLGNLFRDQLDRYGELEHVADRWRAAAVDLPPATVLVLNADDPQVASLADSGRESVRFGLDDERHARRELQHAADSKWCVRCGTAYEYRAAYIGHLGDYRCPNCGHARPAL